MDNSAKQTIIETVAARLRNFIDSNPQILGMRPADLINVDGLVLADLSPSTSKLAAPLQLLQAEFA